jgi:hypothetical protein
MFESQKQKRVTFCMRWNLSPALFKALDGFGRNTQQLGHLSLGFSQVMPDLRKFPFVHGRASLLQTGIYHNVALSPLVPAESDSPAAAEVTARKWALAYIIEGLVFMIIILLTSFTSRPKMQYHIVVYHGIEMQGRWERV